MAARAERRERRRLLDARFPALKHLDDFRFADNPKIPQATIAALAEGSWINDRGYAHHRHRHESWRFRHGLNRKTKTTA